MHANVQERGSSAVGKQLKFAVGQPYKPGSHPSALCLLLWLLQFDEATALSAERLENQFQKVRQTIDEDKRNGMETPYALIIDGKALLYALSPRLRQLFLEVRCVYGYVCV